jgi:hypothetical protein
MHGADAAIAEINSIGALPFPLRAHFKHPGCRQDSQFEHFPGTPHLPPLQRMHGCDFSSLAHLAYLVAEDAERKSSLPFHRIKARCTMEPIQEERPVISTSIAWPKGANRHDNLASIRATIPGRYFRTVPF